MQQGLEHQLIQFEGDIASSKFERIKKSNVTVTRLNDTLLKISFDFNRRSYSFRVFAEEATEGTLFRVQKMVGIDYIISGESGFMIEKPGIHGGFLSDLGGLFFHISVKFFTGDHMEVFFFGKQKAVGPDSWFTHMKLA